MKQFLRIASVALLSVLVLSACGFRLRGTGPQPVLPFKTLFLSVAEGSPIAVPLRRNLDAMSNIEIVSDRKQADAALEVLNEGRDKQVLSLNSQGRVREYTLLYRDMQSDLVQQVMRRLAAVKPR